MVLGIVMLDLGENASEMLIVVMKALGFVDVVVVVVTFCVVGMVVTLDVDSNTGGVVGGILDMGRGVGVNLGWIPGRSIW